MNLSLQRSSYGGHGIFGRLVDEDGAQVAATLEHAFPATGGGWTPALPAGTYTCVRGQHLLHGMTTPFTTFEVTGVPGHTGILFHWGNFNEDSEGCILLGSRANSALNMIYNSRATFAQFMAAYGGLDSFTLVVS